MLENPVAPMFVYVIQESKDRKFEVISRNNSIPRQVVMASLRAELKLLEKEFLDKYKSNNN
ncbi:MAG: hypothetical protein AABX51_01075 [Nanoarchaeota archaeon]